MATDADAGEEIVIWTAYPFADVPRYCTASKKSFCSFVEVNGERKAKYKRLMNMIISEAAIERLEDEGFRGPVRKRLQIILERAGCKSVRFHDLRHTFATASLENGMDVKTLSAIIGHVSSATTLNTCPISPMRCGGRPR